MSMTMTDVYEVVCLLGASEAKSGPYGVSWGPLRVERGSGIAGCGDIWAITFPGTPEIEAITGLRTKAQLRKALRDHVLRYLRFGIAVAKAHEAFVKLGDHE